MDPHRINVYTSKITGIPGFIWEGFLYHGSENILDSKFGRTLDDLASNLARSIKFHQSSKHAEAGLPAYVVDFKKGEFPIGKESGELNSIQQDEFKEALQKYLPQELLYSFAESPEDSDNLEVESRR